MDAEKHPGISALATTVPLEVAEGDNITEKKPALVESSSFSSEDKQDGDVIIRTAQDAATYSSARDAYAEEHWPNRVLDVFAQPGCREQGCHCLCIAGEQRCLFFCNVRGLDMLTPSPTSSPPLSASLASQCGAQCANMLSRTKVRGV